MAAKALEFTVFTAVRTNEALGATWDEVDFDAKVWTVPAERMKGKKREHRVPLTDAVIRILEAQSTNGSELIFPAPRGGKFSDMSMTAVLRRMAVDATTHGFRSTFRDWAGERTSYPRDMAEQALAHTIPNAVEAAYRRGDMLEKRRAMMQDWASFCEIVGD